MKITIAKTYVAKEGEITKKWYLVDATDKILGRMATRVATILMGKHKPTYTPHIDTGDFVIITNASKIKLTGKKTSTKFYQRYSGYGGRNVTPFEKMFAKHPDYVVREAVRKMLPKTKLGSHMIDKLKVYGDATHLHQSQKPEILNIET